MFKDVPHVIPYQGSKRKLASSILSFVNFKVDKFYEPFAGSAALTIAAAANNIASTYVVNDKLESLASLLSLIIEDPKKISTEYRAIWDGHVGGSYEHYMKIRDIYNHTKSPSALLYLVARCVKNAVRFNSAGDFNQFPDKRRLGMHPDKFEESAYLVSRLLAGKTSVHSLDFRELTEKATDKDCVYLDPPWQGTTFTRDQRYAHLLNLDHLVLSLEQMNSNNVPYLLSFDGSLGEKKYGDELPDHLNLTLVQLHAGRSSQATLLGRSDMTIESLYLSPALVEKNGNIKSLKDATSQLSMFS